jgi:hypothetical protein
MDAALLAIALLVLAAVGLWRAGPRRAGARRMGARRRGTSVALPGIAGVTPEQCIAACRGYDGSATPCGGVTFVYGGAGASDLCIPGRPTGERAADPAAYFWANPATPAFPGWDAGVGSAASPLLTYTSGFAVTPDGCREALAAARAAGSPAAFATLSLAAGAPRCALLPAGAAFAATGRATDLVTVAEPIVTYAGRAIGVGRTLTTHTRTGFAFVSGGYLDGALVTALEFQFEASAANCLRALTAIEVRPLSAWTIANAPAVRREITDLANGKLTGAAVTHRPPPTSAGAQRALIALEFVYSDLDDYVALRSYWGDPAGYNARYMVAAETAGTDPRAVFVATTGSRAGTAVWTGTLHADALRRDFLVGLDGEMTRSNAGNWWVTRVESAVNATIS